MSAIEEARKSIKEKLIQAINIYHRDIRRPLISADDIEVDEGEVMQLPDRGGEAIVTRRDFVLFSENCATEIYLAIADVFGSVIHAFTEGGVKRPPLYDIMGGKMTIVFSEQNDVFIVCEAMQSQKFPEAVKLAAERKYHHEPHSIAGDEIMILHSGSPRIIKANEDATTEIMKGFEVRCYEEHGVMRMDIMGDGTKAAYEQRFSQIEARARELYKQSRGRE